MSVNADISFINIYSSEQFHDAVRSAGDTEIAVFCIKAPLKVEECIREKVREAADILRKILPVTVLVIDNVIDYTMLDCVIGADICLVTPNGRFNNQSEYIPTGVYTKEQIQYLLACGEDDIPSNCADESGNFLNGPLVTEILKDIDSEDQLTEYVKSYVDSLAFGKRAIQMRRIKEHFNSFKAEDWSRREKIMNQESKHFCYLAHHINEV